MKTTDSRDITRIMSSSNVLLRCESHIPEILEFMTNPFYVVRRWGVNLKNAHLHVLTSR